MKQSLFNKPAPPNQEQILFEKNLIIGKNHDNKHIILCIKLKTIYNSKGKQTVWHTITNMYEVLSITGQIGRGRQCICVGQIQDHLLDDIATYLIPKEIVEKIINIWNYWHLNDLHPNCCHQKAFDCNIKNYEELAEAETKKCPHGYKYGSKWLLEELDSDVIEFVKSL